MPAMKVQDLSAMPTAAREELASLNDGIADQVEQVLKSASLHPGDKLKALIAYRDMLRESILLRDAQTSDVSELRAALAERDRELTQVKGELEQLRLEHEQLRRTMMAMGAPHHGGARR